MLFGLHLKLASLLTLIVAVREVQSNAGVFTYYETPMFYRIGNDGYIMAHEPEVGFGPSQWRNIIFPPVIAPSGNQCGGIGQSTGYGQSPVVIPEEVRDTCDTDLSGYVFEGGDCTWEDLQFSIILNGLFVNATQGSDCSMGRMKIPGNDNFFNVLQYHIHTGSEHSVEGVYHPAELHVVHQEETQESFAVFGMFIDTNPEDKEQDHEMFEYYLQGWEASARVAEEFCAVNPDGSGEWGPFSVFESRQMRVRCPKPGEGIDPATVEWDNSTGMPVRATPSFPVNASLPHVYKDLPTPGYGVYAYRGGLTTPPCTEIVNWNLLDTPLHLSQSQLQRLYHLVLCMTEPSTCKHATIANEAGLTNRPVQDLHERTILHRCADGPVPEDFRGVPVPVSEEYGYAHNQVRRCVLGGNGGPLQLCWTDTVLEHFGLIFPWFTMAIGLVGFFVLTRYISWFPYTALMFTVGIILGFCSVAVDATDQLSSSIRMWEDIGAEVILLAFLPGLIFRDAYTSNVFLFQKAFWQCLIMAFPGVLAGTALTACVGFYVLPYGWSWSFCFTFGAILSATDPVAVSSLLNEVGAPPRLKIHISGESLLNDGSAIVFFTIFSQIFMSELGVPGFGTDVDWATGIGLFLRMSLGAVVIGIVFSVGLLGIVFLLNRKFNYEESIVQVMASIASAYLCYYVADAVFATSGVIAVLVLGVITKFYSSSLFNDTDMMEKFWVLVEHMLNTVLFTLGGMVWGRIISNQDPLHNITFHFDPQDYGYFVLVWALLIVIRYFLVFASYPIINRIGLRTNVREAVFMGWGGLRGAVGIALAIHMDSHVNHQFFRTDPRRRFTTQLFGIVGGVSFLTLVINGTLAGPLLRKLGLAKTGEARRAVAFQYKKEVKRDMFAYLLKLLGQPRFSKVDFAAVKKHISWFDDLTSSEIRYLVKRNKETTPILNYNQPNLASFKPFLEPDIYNDVIHISKADAFQKLRSVFLLASAVALGKDEKEEFVKFAQSTRFLALDEKSMDLDDDDYDECDKEDTVRDVSDSLIELRKVFVDLLDKAYDQLFESGEVEVRNVNMVVSYKTAVEVSRDEVAKGHALQDWDLVVTAMVRREKILQMLSCGTRGRHRGNSGKSILVQLNNDLVSNARDIIYFGTGFIEAHTRAQAAFKSTSAGQLLSDEKMRVLEESQHQVEAANATIALINQERVTTIVVHLVCQILLNKGGEWIGHLNEQGMLKDQEAEHFLEEIQHDLDGISNCHGEWVLLPCAAEEEEIMESTEHLPDFETLLAQKEELEKLLEQANQRLGKKANVTFDETEKVIASDDAEKTDSSDLEMTANCEDDDLESGGSTDGEREVIGEVQV